MSERIKLAVEPVLSIANGLISGAYAAIGSFEFPTSIIYFQNLTDASMMISFDGVNDAFPLAVNGFFLLDITSNKSSSDGLFIELGQVFWVKQLAGAASTGSLYVTSFYGKN